MLANPFAQIGALILAAAAGFGAVTLYPLATRWTWRSRRLFLAAMFGSLAVTETLFTVVYLDGLIALVGKTSPHLSPIWGELLLLFGIPISVGLSAWSWWYIAVKHRTCITDGG